MLAIGNILEMAKVAGFSVKVLRSLLRGLKLQKVQQVSASLASQLSSRCPDGKCWKEMERAGKESGQNVMK